MKRLCAAILTLLLTVSLLSLAPGAASTDKTPDPAVWAEVELRPLYIQRDYTLYSGINKDFSVEWPKFPIPEIGGEDISTVNMRGFALSPDGRYCYMGTQHGGQNRVRGVTVLRTMTGEITDFYYHYDGPSGNRDVPFSYPKSIAADTRGYVYIGMTYSESYNVAHLAICRQEADGTLAEVAYVPICDFGPAGDTGGKKVGVYGVDVVELGGRTYCYAMTNYDCDALLRYDVTDPENPVLSTDFGSGGRLDFAGDILNPHGLTLTEGLYMDVDSDGTVYLAANAQGGRDVILVLQPDGKACRRVIDLDDVYCVEILGDLLLCGLQSGNQVAVLDRASGRRLASLSTADGYGERITRIQILGDVIFVADAASLAAPGNAIYVGGLSEAGLDFISEILVAQNTGEDPLAPEDTRPEGTTPEGTRPEEGATAPPLVLVPPETTPEEEADTGATDPPAAARPTGCTSAIAGLPAALLAGLIIAAAAACRRRAA